MVVETGKITSFEAFLVKNGLNIPAFCRLWEEKFENALPRSTAYSWLRRVRYGDGSAPTGMNLSRLAELITGDAGNLLGVYIEFREAKTAQSAPDRVPG
ncbi:hypothetical protein J7K50_01055 [bacterium]|nr:hypothetical protein [bacterium]